MFELKKKIVCWQVGKKKEKKKLHKLLTFTHPVLYLIQRIRYDYLLLSVMRGWELRGCPVGLESAIKIDKLLNIGGERALNAEHLSQLLAWSFHLFILVYHFFGRHRVLTKIMFRDF